MANRAVVSVLVVEDNPGDVRLIEEALGTSAAASFAVTVADTLDQAREKLIQHTFDIVLTDLGLPDSEGLGTLSALLGKAPTLPVVVLTGHTDDEIGVRAVHLGAQDHISKRDLTSERLVRCLAFALERHRYLRHLALVDELTGLYNRRGLLVLADKKLAEARRQKRPLFVLYLDIDDFKLVNDTYGHAEGDTVLRQVAAILQATFRASDIVARLGGDEFAVLGIDSEGEQSAGPGERLRRALDTHNRCSGAPYAISFSVGLRHFRPDEVTLDRALGDADAEMYSQKHLRPPGQTETS